MTVMLPGDQAGLVIGSGGKKDRFEKKTNAKITGVGAPFPFGTL